MTIHFRGGRMSAGEIAARFGHSWATTTGHLNGLVDAGLLIRDREGRSRVYRIDFSALAPALDWLRWFEGNAAEQTRAALAPAKPAPSRARRRA